MLELMYSDLVSVSKRYSKYPFWNVSLESELLQNLDNLNSSQNVDLEPIIEYPSWSLSILPEIELNLSKKFQSIPVTNRLINQRRKNRLKLKEHELLQGKIFNKEEDWNDLLIVQGMLAKEDLKQTVPPAVTQSELEDDITFDTIKPEDIIPELTPEPKLTRKNKNPSNLTREIRLKIYEAKSKEKAKYEALDELRKLRKPPKGIVRSQVGIFKNNGLTLMRFLFKVEAARNIQGLR